MKVTGGLVFIDSYVVGVIFSLLMILAVSITHIKEILVWKYTKETHRSTFSVSVAWKTSRCLGFKGKFRCVIVFSNSFSLCRFCFALILTIRGLFWSQFLK